MSQGIAKGIANNPALKCQAERLLMAVLPNPQMRNHDRDDWEDLHRAAVTLERYTGETWIVSGSANADFTEAVIRFADGSRLEVVQRVGTRSYMYDYQWTAVSPSGGRSLHRYLIERAALGQG